MKQEVSAAEPLVAQMAETKFPVVIFLSPTTGQTEAEQLGSGAGFLQLGISMGVVISEERILEIRPDPNATIVHVVGSEPVTAFYSDYETSGQKVHKALVSVREIQRIGEVFFRCHLFTDFNPVENKKRETWVELSYALMGSNEHAPIRVVWSCIRTFWRPNG